LLKLFLALLAVSFIGYIDHLSGAELSFAFFYLIPITIFAFSKSSSKWSIGALAFFASLLWFFAEYYGRIYSSIFFPIWNAFVRLAIFLTIGFLILHLRERQRRINEANQELKRLSDEKNKFVGMAAHDIRNPVGAIYSFSDLILMNHKDSAHPDIVEGLSYIKDISQNTLVILRNLLDISQIEAGKVELKMADHDFELFVRNQIVMNQMIANQKSIQITLDSHISGSIASFDEHYLSQVLNNLLSNAIKYSDRSTLITVKLTEKNERIRVEVVDQGRGIPKEEQEKLFNYFQTTSTLPTEGEQSTGLGLAIAKRIVTMHGGEIGVKSEPGVGSTFYFEIHAKT
jgi:signal transduction histidine kinase